MPQHLSDTERQRQEDRYKVTPGRTAAAIGAAGTAVYGTKVGGAYRMRAANKFLTDQRMARAAAKGFHPKTDKEAARIHRKLNPTADRWQKTFAGQRRIKTAGPAPKGHGSIWLHPTKSRAAYDKEVLNRGIRNAPVHEGRLYRGMATDAANARGTQVPHEHMSAWTSKPEVAEHYADSGRVYSEMPGFIRRSRNVDANKQHTRVLQHERGQAFNLTPFASKYNDSNIIRMAGGRRNMPDEYLMGPGVYKSLYQLGEISKQRQYWNWNYQSPKWRINDTKTFQASANARLRKPTKKGALIAGGLIGGTALAGGAAHAASRRSGREQQ